MENFSIDKNKALCLIVHACDISHASKPWHLHSRWTEGVLEEFFRQGDLEASMGLPYSPLCDRHTVHVADSQIGMKYLLLLCNRCVDGLVISRILRYITSFCFVRRSLCLSLETSEKVSNPFCILSSCSIYRENLSVA